MIIRRTSKFSGITREVELPVTVAQMGRFESGLETLQDIFPNLNVDDREFIKTGITADEWDQMFAETTI
jgi:hypothetical protein